MFLISRVTCELFDPRGRCDRKGLLILAGIILVLEAVFGLVSIGLGLSLDGPAMIAFKVVFVWTAVAAACKRLHDLGRSGWWLLGGFIALVLWTFAVATAVLLLAGPEELAHNAVLYAVVMASSMVPAFVALLWLHCAKGHVTENKYGSPPDELGFSRGLYQGVSRSHTAAA